MTPLPVPAWFLLHPRLPVTSRQCTRCKTFKPRSPRGPRAASLPALGAGTLSARVVFGYSALAWVLAINPRCCCAVLLWGRGASSPGGRQGGQTDGGVSGKRRLFLQLRNPHGFLLPDISFVPRVGDAFTRGGSSLAGIATSLGQRPPRILTGLCFALGPSLGGDSVCNGSSLDQVDKCPPRWPPPPARTAQVCFSSCEDAEKANKTRATPSSSPIQRRTKEVGDDFTLGRGDDAWQRVRAPCGLAAPLLSEVHFAVSSGG